MVNIDKYLFEKQEKKMEKFLEWMRFTVHSVQEISNSEYKNIFEKIQWKAKR